MISNFGTIKLPPHTTEGSFDHADVHIQSSRVFVANTANGTVEVIDGEELRHLATIQGCPEASGVLCAQKEDLVFAASRGTGKILAVNAHSLKVEQEFTVGSKPNGLAWDSKRKHLLVADVQDSTVRLTDPLKGQALSSFKLAGRPRWCCYDKKYDVFFVNIKEPPQVVVLSAEELMESTVIPISKAGPHGMDIDEEGRRLFVACDASTIVALDLQTKQEIKTIQISGQPDVLWYNSQRSRLYCAVGSPGVIEVIDTKSMDIVEKVATEEDAHTLTFDQFRQRLYSFLPHSCSVQVYKEE
ncbi:MAG: YncE family protein [Nitrososphaerales archaeon]